MQQKWRQFRLVLQAAESIEDLLSVKLADLLSQRYKYARIAYMPDAGSVGKADQGDYASGFCLSLGAHVRG